MKEIGVHPIVYDYTEFNPYIADYFSAEKDLNPDYSYAYLSTRLGFSSKSQVNRLLKGEQKKHSQNLLHLLSDYMGHSDQERDYFLNLSAFSEASSLKEKNFYYTKMHKILRPLAQYQLRSQEFTYLKEWYLPVLRELICIYDFKGNFNKLANMLNPPITCAQAKNGVELLLQLGLVEANNPLYRQKSQIISAQGSLKKLAVRQHQTDQIQVLADQLQNGKGGEHLGAITFGLNAQGQDLVHQKISDFLAELGEISAQYDSSMDQVFQFNVQFYPISHSIINEVEDSK
jgi:uncharacterized protein (TIGR02147 family)